MKKYYIASRADRVEYFEITGESADGFLVKLVRIYDGIEKVAEEKLSRDLFDLCLRTGYIFEKGAEKAGECAA